MAKPVKGSSLPRHAPSFRATTALSFAYQGSTTLYGMLLPGVIAREYGAAALGVWFTLYSLLSLGMSFNLGVPGGLFARVDGRDNADRRANIRNIASAFTLTLRLCVVWLTVVIGTVVLPVESWFALGGAVGSAGPVLRVFLCATALMLVANLAQPLYFALFRSHLAYRVATLVHVAAVPCAILAAKLTSRFWLVSVVFLSPPIVSGLSLLWLGIRRGYIEIGASDREFGRDFLKFSARYFVVEALSSAILRSPEVVLSYSQGFVEAGRFSTYVRFPLLLSSVSALILQPAWPALVAATREFDTKQARVIVRHWLYTLLLLWSVFAIAVLSLGKKFVAAWLGSAHVFSYTMLVLAVTFALAQALHFWTVLALLGLGDLRASIRTNAIMFCVFVPLLYVLSARFAATGTIVALIVVFGVVGAPLGFRACRARLQQLEANPTSSI